MQLIVLKWFPRNLLSTQSSSLSALARFLETLISPFFHLAEEKRLFHLVTNKEKKYIFLLSRIISLKPYLYVTASRFSDTIRQTTGPHTGWEVAAVERGKGKGNKVSKVKGPGHAGSYKSQ